MKKKTKTLNLYRETLYQMTHASLEPEELRRVFGGIETRNRTCIEETAYCETNLPVCTTSDFC